MTDAHRVTYWLMESEARWSRRVMGRAGLLDFRSTGTGDSRPAGPGLSSPREAASFLSWWDGALMWQLAHSWGISPLQPPNLPYTFPGRSNTQAGSQSTPTCRCDRKGPVSVGDSHRDQAAGGRGVAQGPDPTVRRMRWPTRAASGDFGCLSGLSASSRSWPSTTLHPAARLLALALLFQPHQSPCCPWTRSRLGLGPRASTAAPSPSG